MRSLIRILGFLAGLLAVAAGAADILLVTGDSNRTVPTGGKSLGDAFVEERLRLLGHRASFAADSLPRADLLSAAARSQLVMLMESVTSTRLVDKLKAVAVPLINCEAFVQDELGMTAIGPAGDPGAPDRFALGVLEGQTELRIRNAGHPLAAGLAGTVSVYRQPKAITWGKVGQAAQVVATLANDSAGAAVYVYSKGDRLFDGTAAAGHRIGFFLEDDNQTGTANLMTSEGLRLFDAAVAYALAGPTSAASRLEPARPTVSAPPRDFLGRLTPTSTLNFHPGYYAIRP